MSSTGYVVTGGGGEGGPVSWGDVQGKPSTFPPDAHSHTYASITSKPSTFPPDAHGHAQSDVTGLTAALAEPARVFTWNGSAYVLDSTVDIYIGPSDPGSGLWIDSDA